MSKGLKGAVQGLFSGGCPGHRPSGVELSSHQLGVHHFMDDNVQGVKGALSRDCSQGVVGGCPGLGFQTTAFWGRDYTLTKIIIMTAIHLCITMIFPSHQQVNTFKLQH